MTESNAETHQRIIKALRRLERDWPKDGTMLMATGTGLFLCTKNPNAGGKEIASFNIPNDGGDPDWATDV